MGKDKRKAEAAVKVSSVRSDAIYQKMIQAPREKKTDIYRYELMKPFEKKWAYYHIPLKAAKPGGYDIIIAADMLGFLLPEKIDAGEQEHVALLSDDALWKSCEEAISASLDSFIMAGIDLPVREYLFTLLLANPENPYCKLCNGYSGDGGIPGYIMGWLTPNDYTLGRLPAALAHETNHNVRYQFIAWHNDISLGEMLVSEGLAENFAAWRFGEEMLGPWVSKTELDELNDYIKPIMVDGLNVQGLAEINAYLYGDEIALMQGYEPVGLPYCAGYACGYYLVKYYLEKTGKSIVEATLLPAEEILKEVQDFWTTPTKR